MILVALVGCGPAAVEGFWVELHGRVVDEAGEPVTGARVSLATAEGALLADVGTSSEGEWRAPVYGTTRIGNVLVGLVRADGFAEGRVTWEVELQSPEVVPLDAGPGQTWGLTSRQLAAVHLADDTELATVSGRVVHAVTGAPVAGVPLSLQVGWNAPVGDASAGATETDDTGRFVFEASRAGMYTVTASETSATGAARFPAFLTDAGGTSTGVVGPPVEAGQLRATLAWGDRPFDLDLHLTAPLKGGIAGADGTGQLHVWSGEPVHPERAEGEEREAWLERTDADGQGPESVWVESLAEQGEVRISVFDADNRSDASSGDLSASHAVVQVWFGEDTPRHYTASPGEIATLWRPVELDVATYTTYAVEQWSFGAAPNDAAAF